MFMTMDSNPLPIVFSCNFFLVSYVNVVDGLVSYFLCRSSIQEVSFTIFFFTGKWEFVDVQLRKSLLIFNRSPNIIIRNFFGYIDLFSVLYAL